MALGGTDNFLPSWKDATDPTDAPAVRTLDADGTLHFTHLKKVAKSGVQYLYSVNTETEPTRDMRIGTVVHKILLGARPGAKDIVRYAKRRAGAEWEAFEALHKAAGNEIVSNAEWAEAEAMAESVRRSPIARARMRGAKFETPLRWEENGVPCSTSGVDIFPADGGLGDLKATRTTDPEPFKAHAFRMGYPQQLAWYRRGARANGITVKDLFILGVELKAPHEVVELYLTEKLIDMAEASLTLWIERLRGYMLAIPKPRSVYDWPGYAMLPIPWEPPAWATDEDGDEECEEDAA